MITSASEELKIVPVHYPELSVSQSVVISNKTITCLSTPVFFNHCDACTPLYREIMSDAPKFSNFNELVKKKKKSPISMNRSHKTNFPRWSDCAIKGMQTC